MSGMTRQRSDEIPQPRRSQLSTARRIHVQWDHVEDEHAADRLLQVFTLLFRDEFGCADQGFDKIDVTVHPCTGSR